MQRNRSAHTACCGPIIIYRLGVRGGGGGRGFGGGDTWFSGTTKGKGGSVVFIRVFETGNYRKLTTNEGGSLEYYRALRDQVIFVVAK